MSDRPAVVSEYQGSDLPLHRILSDEGFRLFFPLTALHAALWPFLWIAVWSLSLPFGDQLPAGFWHMTEMIVGSWGAALLGFLTTAAPEWTDTPRLRGRPLWVLAALWGAGRLIGLLGWEPALILAGLADLGWMLGLLYYLGKLSLERHTSRLLAFMAWLGALSIAAGAGRLGMVLGDIELARHALVLAGMVFLGLLGLALSRITVPITNIVLDPTEASSPFRPHPGRLNLATGLVACALVGELADLSVAVTGFLWVAAGAGFLDRVAEGFVGREAFRSEVLVLMGASAFSGLGLLTLGASRLGAPGARRRRCTSRSWEVWVWGSWPSSPSPVGSIRDKDLACGARPTSPSCWCPLRRSFGRCQRWT